MINVQREELAALEPEWRQLLPGCRLRYPFLSPTWLRAWWEEFADGRELVLLSARRGDQLVGVLPLMRDGSILSFAGDTQVCDYMDLAAGQGLEEELLNALLRSISEEPWEELRLWALHENSATLAALSKVCAGLRLAVTQEVEDVCPQVDLPDSWDNYLESLTKKDRHELRRKLRRLPQGGEVALEVLDSPAEIDAAMGDFLRMHTASRAEKAVFMTERMERFFRRTVAALAAEGLAEMVFLTLGGTRVASVLCFRGDGEVLLYNSGYDPAYAGLSVGLLSKALALQRAIEQGRRRFDFLRGREPYKYDLGARDVSVYRCIVRRE